MSDFDDFVKQAENKKRLHGADIVKKNEEYITKHRKEAYQKQKAETEKNLRDALESNKFRAEHPLSLDETSKWYNDRMRAIPYSEPGLEYRPRGPGRFRIPERRLRGIHIINRCIVT
jgi:hypothetical protein